ncbi:MAG: GIY-YIG nuclease family protein [Gammaproteobacteria bacterium]|nr:GIY-YIG nuclease family protein [Gammaproteobacteria bacterium]
MNERHYTYILASKRNGALYVGVTTNLLETVLDHKCNMVVGITSQYAIHQLVYFECNKDAGSALLREQAIRQMHRIWKLDLIEQHNPTWCDLYAELSNPGDIPKTSYK